MPICKHCGKSFKKTNKRGKVSAWCPKCREKGQRNRFTPDARRAGNLRSRFKISVDEWEEMFEIQGGGCLGCGKTEEENGRRLAVDHDHITGKNRGLLCFDCNVVLGKVDDDPKVLRTLAAYLERG